MPSLYVTERGARLMLEGGRLVCMRDDDVLVAAPAARVDRVIMVGGAHITIPAMTLLLDRGIPLAFVTASGTMRGTLHPDAIADVSLRRQQYRLADDPERCLSLGRAFIAGKLHNSRVRALDLAREHDPENPAPSTGCRKGWMRWMRRPHSSR